MMEHFYEQKKKKNCHTEFCIWGWGEIFKNERKIKTFGETELSEFTTAYSLVKGKTSRRGKKQKSMGLKMGKQ